MKRLQLIIINLLFITTLAAQPTFSKTYRVAADNYFFTEFGSIVDTDSAYYVSGVTRDTLDGYLINRGMLMKIDTNGNQVWSRIYGDTTKTTETWYDAMITTNQGYLANIGRNSDGTGFLLIIDYEGNVIVNKNYSDTNSILLTGVAQDDSDDFYLFGTFFYRYGCIAVLIKTDSLGNEIWRQYYDAHSNIDTTYGTYSNDIFINNNNELILASITDKNDYQHHSYEEGTWIIKLDTAGNLLNQYHSPNNRLINAPIITLTENDDILFYRRETRSRGNSSAFDYEGYIGKLDNNLQLVWEKRYGTGVSRFFHVKEKDNGHLIVTGSKHSYSEIDSTQFTGWIMELDENGDSLWQQEHTIFPGVYQWHALGDFEFLDDGRMIMSGYIENWTPNDGSNRGYWGWLIRTDSLGCIVPGCQLLDNTENIKVLFDNEMTVFPNPASDVVNFKFDKVINEKAVIRVYSGLGQLIGETAIDYSDMAQINVSDWQSGMYFYGVYVENQLVKQGQVLVSE